MNTNPIRIILVDDHKLVRESWRMLLGTSPLFQIIGESDNGQAAIEMAEEHIPDIMLVDINMTPINGFTVTERITEKLPSVKIIGLSVSNQSKYATRMLALGAKGYLTKTSSLEEIRHGIIEVYNGNIYICEEIRKNMPGG